MKRVKVSNNVIRRLPRYLRKLDDLMQSGVTRVSSFELGQLLGLTPSQIRQDFSCFGEFGQQGYGYNVKALRSHIASILGIDKAYSPHALRNNFAKRCLMNGMDIYTLSRILGHSSVSVTENAYLDLTDRDLRHRYQNFSPMENLRP